MPETLDETYDRTLEEIGKQNWEYAHRLFQCVAAASRPLRVKELAEFLAFDFDTDLAPTLREDWREEGSAHAVRSTCSSLLAIVDVGGSSVIKFALFLLKEYLTSKRLTESKETISRFRVSMTLAHTVIAQACLGLLLHIDENTTEDDLERFPLTAYAAKHWAAHARFEGVSRNIQDGIKRLFDPSDRHFPVWVWIYHLEWSGDILDIFEDRTRANGTPLHYAVFSGLHDVVKFLIVERFQNVNARGFDEDETPLTVASRRGYSKVSRVLLEHGADMETRDRHNYNPLDRASEKGHMDVIRVLLERHADVNSSDELDCVTALHLASSYGDAAIVRMLLVNGADVNAREIDKETPLHRAINHEVTGVLLEYGADPNARDNSNLTPLHRAIECKLPEVVRVLLENGADTTARDAKNQTPLHLASETGDLDGVRLLLQHNADIHARDDEGLTPFQVASESPYLEQHQNVMRLLLEHGAEDLRTQ